MRVLLGAAIAALACGAAWAQTVSTSDAAKTFSFDKPQKWPALEDKSRPGAPVKEFVAGTANEECWFNIIPRPETASTSPATLAKSWVNEIPANEWTETTKTARLLMGGGTFKSSSIDASRTFPIQQAIFDTKDGPVYVAIHPRPGQEIRVFCGAYDGKDHAAILQGVARSVTTPQDADYASRITAVKEAEQLAAAAAAAAAAADPKKKK